jgi:hypothetical protein
MDIVQNIRDIMISLYLILGVLLTLAMLLFAFLLYRAMRALLRSLTRAADNFGKVSDAAVEHVVTPLKEGASAASVAGNVLGFVTGYISGLRGRKAGDKADEGEGSGLGGLRRWLPF